MLKKLFYTVLLIVAFVSLFSFYAYGEISQSSNDFRSQGFAGNVCNTSATMPLMLSKEVNCITTLGNGLNISYVAENPNLQKQWNVSRVTYYINIYKENSTIYYNLSFQGSHSIKYLCYEHGAGLYKISTYVVADTNNSSAISPLCAVLSNTVAVLVSKPANPTELIYPGLIFGVISLAVFILARIYGEDTKYAPEKLLRTNESSKSPEKRGIKGKFKS